MQLDWPLYKYAEVSLQHQETESHHSDAGNDNDTPHPESLIIAPAPQLQPIPPCPNATDDPPANSF